MIQTFYFTRSFEYQHTYHYIPIRNNEKYLVRKYNYFIYIMIEYYLSFSV